MKRLRTRLAPSPTGALHLGNARTFLVTWAIARRANGTLPMRIEDLDGPRVKPGSEAAMLDTLRWLGLDWDGPIERQSDDVEPYRTAMRQLSADGLIFRCDHSRSEIEAAASAPHAGDHELHFPASLRPPPGSKHWGFAGDGHAHRFRVEPGPRVIQDQLRGSVSIDVGRSVGDVQVWTRAGGPAYQLAVVVDDARQDVTDVIRGDDLLPSAARQELLHLALGSTPPRWWHLPLVLGPDGRRLAKRHGDTRVATYREAGVPASRIIGWTAWTCGLLERPAPMDASEFLQALDPDTLAPGPPAVTFTPEDHRWLCSE
ncbi:MAG: glutamate--tRNA ligase family protein [Phycisphaerales bacterium]